MFITLPFVKDLRNKWHLLYYLLATFDILTVLLSLYLGYRIMNIYRASVQVNQAWVIRAEQYAELGQRMAAVNAPGNDVFASKNTAQEEARLQVAIAEFEKQFNAVQTELQQNIPTQQYELMLHDLAIAHTKTNAMVTAATAIFMHLRTGNATVAGQHMAAMDRDYAAAFQALSRLREHVNLIQKQIFDEQMAQAAALQKFEYLIAFCVLLMVAAATFYGHKVSNRLRANAREKGRYIAQLQDAENNLRQARDELEIRVAQRTQELAAANSELQTEIHERARIENDLRTAATRLEQSNRDLQDFASIASHDLQEPLRKVQVFSERIRTKYHAAFDETGIDYLERVQHAAARMQTLINDLLSYSRVTSKAQAPVPVDLQQIAHEVLGDLETRIERTNATIELGTLPVVIADPTQMRQVLQNLIGNGLKFCQPEIAPIVKIHSQQEADYWRIEITDNGIGFEEKYLDKIFGIFQRLHGRSDYEGSGVGLAVVKKIIERHNGTVTARSQPGQGATFIVTLPATTETAPIAQRAAA